MGHDSSVGAGAFKMFSDWRVVVFIVLRSLAVILTVWRHGRVTQGWVLSSILSLLSSLIPVSDSILRRYFQTRGGKDGGFLDNETLAEAP